MNSFQMMGLVSAMIVMLLLMTLLFVWHLQLGSKISKLEVEKKHLEREFKRLKELVSVLDTQIRGYGRVSEKDEQFFKQALEDPNRAMF